jgi:HrpA-like RNA helicase
VSDAKTRKMAGQLAEACAREAGAGDAGAPATTSVRMPHGTPSLIAALCNHVATPGGCVLCFLPGVGKIEEVAEAVERSMAARSGLIVVHVLHSMVGPLYKLNPIDPQLLVRVRSSLLALS